MTNAIFIGWGAAVRGRELKALGVFEEAVEYWGGLQQRGEIDSVEYFALEPHGGDLYGFLVAKGDPEKLARIRLSEDFTHLNNRADFIVENFGVVNASTGSDLEKQFQDFASIAADLS